MSPLRWDISPSRDTLAAYRNIKISLCVYMGVSFRLSCRDVFHTVSAWRDILSGRDDFLHVNRNRRDILPCRDEIGVTVHAFNPRTMAHKYVADFVQETRYVLSEQTYVSLRAAG